MATARNTLNGMNLLGVLTFQPDPMESHPEKITCAPSLFSEQWLPPNSQVTPSGNVFSEPRKGHHLATYSRHSTVTQSPTSSCDDSNLGNTYEWTSWASTAAQATQYWYSQHNLQTHQGEIDLDVPHLADPDAQINPDGAHFHHAQRKARAQSDSQSRSHIRVHRTARKRVAKSVSDEALNGISAHALVERRYRQTLETRLKGLENALSVASRARTGRWETSHVESDSDNFGGVKNPKDPSGKKGKRRKCDILDAAISYVHETEIDLRHMDEELDNLKVKVRCMEQMQATGGFVSARTILGC